jgi:hypothetical protein
MIRPFLRQHPLIRFLAINMALGFVVAALVVGGLIGFDVFGLRRLILADQSPAVAFVLLAGGFVVTFASTVMGSAIMGLGASPHDRDRGAAPEPTDGAIAVAVEVRRR